MNPLITGGCGFLGSNLAAHALPQGVELCVFDSQARANHYHDLATEWFTILLGRVRLNLRHVDTGEHASPLLDDQSPFTGRINPRVAHSLMGEDHSDYVMMAYTNVRYDAADTIAPSPICMEPGDDLVLARN